MKTREANPSGKERFTPDGFEAEDVASELNAERACVFLQYEDCRFKRRAYVLKVYKEGFS
jgi:hypothetical protein